MYRRFGARWALANVSFRLLEGGALRLTGANGSGKSTLLRVLGTALRADLGSVRVGGLDLWASRGVLRPTLAVYGHATGTWEELSPRDNLVAWNSFGGGTTNVDALLERVGLEAARTDPVRMLSAGQRRRLALARMLLRTPSLALFDEPMTALDVAGRALLTGVLKDLRQAGCTLVIATHDPAEVADVCDADLNLDEGRVA